MAEGLIGRVDVWCFDLVYFHHAPPEFTDGKLIDSFDVTKSCS